MITREDGFLEFNAVTQHAAFEWVEDEKLVLRSDGEHRRAASTLAELRREVGV
jgi:hypothetical protein